MIDDDNGEMGAQETRHCELIIDKTCRVCKVKKKQDIEVVTSVIH